MEEESHETEAQESESNPHILVGEGYIEFYIDNPEFGREKDLVPFYRTEYFELIGLQPEEIEIMKGEESFDSATGQKGGGDDIEGPYRYFAHVLDWMANKIYSFRGSNELSKKNVIQTSPTPTASSATSFVSPATPLKEPATPLKEPATLLKEPATLLKEPATPLKERSDIVSSEESKDINVLNPSSKIQSRPHIHQIRIRFRQTLCESLQKVIEKRKESPNTSEMEYNKNFFTLKEADVLTEIKKRQGMEVLYLEDVYFIHGRIIVLKGLSNNNTQTEITYE